MLISFFIALGGFAALALAMPRHKAQLSPKAARWWRPIGWVLTLGSFIPCVLEAGFSLALTAWLGVLSLAAFSVAMALTYRPHWLRPVGMASVGAGLVVVTRTLWS